MSLSFSLVARKASNLVGTSAAFVIACIVIIIWASTGHLFHYSDTWQLIINTGTTIVTFLMVFLIQNAQNHDAKALHIKLDEIIKSLNKADNQLINIEEKTSEDLQLVREKIKEECKV